MAKTKTVFTEVKVSDFIESFVDSEQKKTDSYQLIELMQKWSGFDAKMWGPSIIGFGSYHYKYASGHEGDAPMIAFSPRTAAFSLYVYSATETSKDLLPNLGKHKMAKSCIYMKKLSDIDLSVLKALCMETIAYLNEHHECACRSQD
ncbi:MAG: hypothetical protein RL632_83 [Bacteroidota bacterium]|jgi:hypothetical protein